MHGTAETKMTHATRLAELTAQAEALASKIRAYRKAVYEGDEMATSFDRDLNVVLAEMKIVIEAAFWDVWTADEFQARKVRWNYLNATMKPKVFKDLAAVEAKAGFTRDEIMRAKAKYAA